MSKNKTAVLTYSCKENGETITTEKEDQERIAEVDKDAIDSFARISFASPKNVLNCNEIELSLDGTTYTQYKFEAQGDYDNATNTMLQLLGELNEFTKDLNISFNVDQNALIRRGKCILTATAPFWFKSSDYWFSKVLGFELDTIYQAETLQREEEQYYQVAFPNRMFLSVLRYLNVVCYDIQVPNFFQFKKQRYVILKQPWQFSPGSYVSVSSDFVVAFSTTKLMYGYNIYLCDENFVLLPIEEGFTLDLTITPNMKMVEKRQQVDDERQRQKAEEAAMKQQQKAEEQARKDLALKEAEELKGSLAIETEQQKLQNILMKMQESLEQTRERQEQVAIELDNRSETRIKEVNDKQEEIQKSLEKKLTELPNEMIKQIPQEIENQFKQQNQAILTQLQEQLTSLTSHLSEQQQNYEQQSEAERQQIIENIQNLYVGKIGIEQYNDLKMKIIEQGLHTTSNLYQLEQGIGRLQETLNTQQKALTGAEIFGNVASPMAEAANLEELPEINISSIHNPDDPQTLNATMIHMPDELQQQHDNAVSFVQQSFNIPRQEAKQVTSASYTGTNQALQEFQEFDTLLNVPERSAEQQSYIDQYHQQYPEFTEIYLKIWEQVMMAKMKEQ